MVAAANSGSAAAAAEQEDPQEVEGGDDSENSKSMFFTTSDLLQRMNQSIAELSGRQAPPGDSGGFELRRKMPDGSTRRADASDAAVADLQSKIKQTAAVLSNLTAEEKLEWAKAQRAEGNAIYARGQYQEAMDVYITCLVAMDKLDAAGAADEADTTTPTDANSRGSASIEISEDIERDIQLPVLLNLAQCALKLGMLRKAEAFCDFALQTSLGKTSAKAYFRRGRARMLMASYDSARLDLTKALDLMSLESSDRDAIDNDMQVAERKSIQNELNKLKRLEIAAKKNEAKHKKAMKRVWANDPTTTATGSGFVADDNANICEVETSVNAIEILGSSSSRPLESKSPGQGEANETCLFPKEQNDNGGLYSDVRERRQFSTLRAKKKVNVEFNFDDEDDEEVEDQQSIFQWYLSLFERCLRKTLQMLGDEEGAKEIVYDKDD